LYQILTRHSRRHFSLSVSNQTDLTLRRAENQGENGLGTRDLGTRDLGTWGLGTWELRDSGRGWFLAFFESVCLAHVSNRLPACDCGIGFQPVGSTSILLVAVPRASLPVGFRTLSENTTARRLRMPHENLHTGFGGHILNAFGKMICPYEQRFRLHLFKGRIL